MSIFSGKSFRRNIEKSDSSIKAGGDVKNNFINNGNARGVDFIVVDNSGMERSQNSKEQQLREDLRKVQSLLENLEKMNPQATEAEKKGFVSFGTSPDVKQRLVAAIAGGGKAAIEQFLDNAYVNIVIAIVEGWKAGSVA